MPDQFTASPAPHQDTCATVPSGTDCAKCDSCILPPEIRPSNAPSGRSDASATTRLAATYLQQLTADISNSPDSPFLNNQIRNEEAAHLARALELSLSDQTPAAGEWMTAESIFFALRDELETASRQRNVMVLWTINAANAMIDGREGFALEGIRQICRGALGLTPENGNLLIGLSEKGGRLILTLQASRFDLTTNWHAQSANVLNDNASVDRCPIPLASLAPLRLGLHLLGLQPQALQLIHHYSQSEISLALVSQRLDNAAA